MASKTEVKPPRILKQYERIRVSPQISNESVVQQSLAAETDINRIMDKYRRGQLVDHVNSHQGQYGDFSSITSYHQAVNQVLEAQQTFDSLPADLRKRFNNDPADFLAFVHDPANKDEMVSLGLAKASPEPSGAPGDIDRSEGAPEGFKPPKTPSEPSEEGS